MDNFEALFEQPSTVKSGIPIDGQNFMHSFYNLGYISGPSTLDSPGVASKYGFRSRSQMWRYSRRILVDSKSRETICFYQQIPPKPLIGNINHRKSINVFRIHDLFPLTHPELYSFRQRVDFSSRLKSVSKLDYAIFNSRNTRDAFLRLFPQVNNWKVIECLVPSFSYDVIYGELGSFTCCEEVSQLEPGFLLAISPLMKRKRTLELVNFWANELRPKDIKLVLVASSIPGVQKDDELSFIENNRFVRDEFIRLADICSYCIMRLYEKAAGFISNSIVEGFNMPLHDAQYFQLPILSSREAYAKSKYGSRYSQFYTIQQTREFAARFKSKTGIRNKSGGNIKPNIRKRILQFESQIEETFNFIAQMKS